MNAFGTGRVISLTTMQASLRPPAISLSGALLVVTNMVRSGLFAVQCYRIQLVWDGMLLAILLIGCLSLIPRFGLMGAAWAMVIGQAIQLATGLAMLFWAARGIGTRQPPAESKSCTPP